MFEGPEAELTLTANAQPALMAVSIAALRVLEAEAGLDLARDAEFVAGHSLGEYSALAAAGAFSSPTPRVCCACADRRCSGPFRSGEGAMAALLGPELDAARRRRRGGRRRRTGVMLSVANDNGGGQVVVSGSKAAVDKAIENAKELGAGAQCC